MRPSPLQVKRNFFDLANKNGLSVVGEYKKKNCKVEVMCSKGHSFSISPESLFYGRRCPLCSNSLTDPNAAKNRFSKVCESKGFEVLSEYVLSGKKVDLKCSNGHLFSSTPASINYGKGCAYCSKKNKRTKEEFSSEIKERGLTLVGPYAGSKVKALIRCKQGHEWMANPHNLISNKSGCPKCSKHCPKQAEENFLKIISKRKYTIKEPYIKADQPILMMCESGHLFRKSPSEIKNGSFCQACTGTNFSTSLPAVIYVYELRRNNIHGLGFGVSNVFKLRDKTHRTTFKKTDTTATLLGVFDFAVGQDAVDVERVLKQHPSAFDFGIVGFRTECLPIHLKDYVLQTISEAVK